MKSKQVIYNIKDLKGKSIVNKGKVDFIEAKYKEPQKVKTYDFSKFTSGIAEPEKVRKQKQKQKENFDFTTASNDNYSIETENDPIQMNNTDSKYLFDNEDAIVVNFKKEKKSES